MGTGPFDDGAEREAAKLLRQLSDYASTVVREEVDRAWLQRSPVQDGPEPQGARRTAGVLLALLGLATLVAASVILLASLLGTGLAALAVGAALLASGLLLSAPHRRPRSRPPDQRSAAPRGQG